MERVRVDEAVRERMPEAIRSYVEWINAGDFERLRRVFTPDAEIWGVLGHGSVAEVEPIWRELHEGMAMHLDPQDVAVDGARVVVRYRETGCFRGPFRGLAGIEPTKRRYEVPAIEWFELEGGLISKRWGARDSAAITRQVTAAQPGG